ncbi:sce7726 family protein [Tenacibaculum ascidiaceicola]|uniref:sce7726 family protein n=1 Tax=Tenacibaculum ascidiaceicola TaxID=1699411 RepID=UPI003894C221
MKDAEIRDVLRGSLLKKYIDDSDSKVVDELTISVTNSRVDIAVVNGHLHGYEIKGANDTLKRITHQIEGYKQVFDYVTVVTESNHLEKLEKKIPDWVGIVLCIEGKKRIKTYRKPRFNREKRGFHLARLLWKDEIKEVLRENSIPFRTKNTVWQLSEVVEKNISVPKLSKIVREKLKNRLDWKVKDYYVS